MQLLECREFFYSEAIFLDWLRIAITMASVAVLLLGFSAMAYVNPLKRPVLHVAEMISLLLLPASCVVAGYAIRVYVWRSKRLHSMRYRCVLLLPPIQVLLSCVLQWPQQLQQMLPVEAAAQEPSSSMSWFNVLCFILHSCCVVAVCAMWVGVAQQAAALDALQVRDEKAMLQ